MNICAPKSTRRTWRSGTDGIESAALSNKAMAFLPIVIEARLRSKATPNKGAIGDIFLKLVYFRCAGATGSSNHFGEMVG